ncbi:MAG: Ig-like domain-containing protein [Pirellulaceae bacterium]|nr:Ig-like domain-containing protein [Pirellulaceae bacterium]
MQFANSSRRRSLRNSTTRRQFLRLECLENRAVLSGASPVAVNDLFNAIVDEPLVSEPAAILANDTGPDGSSLSAELFRGPDHGKLELADDGSFVYTPDAGFLGMDSFVYAATDGESISELAAVTFLVGDGNHAPVAANDSFSTSEDTPLIVSGAGILGNDTDADGDALSIVAGSPLHGTLELADDGSFVYTPDADFTGLDGFSYYVNDGSADSHVATATILVTAANDSPVAVNEEFTIDEDTPLVLEAPGILGNDTDADGDPLSASVVNPPQNGTLVLNADGSLTYTPNANFHGIDGFSYLASDGAANSEAATVTINVLAVADPPEAKDDAYVLDEDTVLTVSEGGVLANDLDGDGDPLTATLVSGPASGSLQLNPDGTFTYTPSANFTGTDSFVYAASDGTTAVEATVTLTVNAVADAAVVAEDAYSTGEDVPLVVSVDSGVLANDFDPAGGPLAAELVAGPEHGTVVLAADGSFTYTPELNHHGAVSFTYKTAAGSEETIGTATITVQPLNDAPVAAGEEFSVIGDPAVPTGGNVLVNDTDIDGDALTATLVQGPAHGTLTLAADGTFEYVAEEGFVGDVSFRYQVNDGLANSTVATAVLHVSAPSEVQINSRPVAVNDSYEATAGQPLVIDVAAGLVANDTDADGDLLTPTLFGQPLHGQVSVNADGSFSYTANADYTGLDAFLYSVSDGELTSAFAAVTIHVLPAVVSPPTETTDPLPETPSAEAEEDDDCDLLAHCLFSPETDPQAIDEAIRCGFGWLNA